MSHSQKYCGICNTRHSITKHHVFAKRTFKDGSPLWRYILNNVIVYMCRDCHSRFEYSLEKFEKRLEKKPKDERCLAVNVYRHALYQFFDGHQAKLTIEYPHRYHVPHDLQYALQGVQRFMKYRSQRLHVAECRKAHVYARVFHSLSYAHWARKKAPHRKRKQQAR